MHKLCIQCNHTDRTELVINKMLLPKCFVGHNLISMGCPVGSYFGQSYVILGLVYCEDPQLYYCNNSNDGTFASCLRCKFELIFFLSQINFKEK